jgi:hypothetical protein
MFISTVKGQNPSETISLLYNPSQTGPSLISINPTLWYNLHPLHGTNFSATWNLLRQRINVKSADITRIAAWEALVRVRSPPQSHVLTHRALS